MSSYDYATERPFVFTEDGQLMLLRIRDRAQSLINSSGAATMMNITAGITGDSWSMLACVDRLVEIGELVEVPNPKSAWGAAQNIYCGEQMTSATETVFPILRKLLFAKRFSRDLLIMPEAVLLHIGFCASYSLFVSERLRQLGLKVNQEELLKRAVLHDFEEAETGDVPRPTKYHSPEATSALQSFARESAKGMFKGQYANFFLSWENAKDDSIEGDILRLTDLAAVIFTINLELDLGNKTAKRIQDEVQGYLATATEKLRPIFGAEIAALQGIIEAEHD